MEFDEYEHKVVPPVRDFLRSRGLEWQVRCLVTFYGVPFRIRARDITPAEKIELADLRVQLDKVMAQAKPIVAQAEKLAQSLNAKYQPPTAQPNATEVETLTRRFVLAMNSATASVSGMTTRTERNDAAEQLTKILAQLGGVAEIFSRFGAMELADPNQTADEHQRWMDLRNQIARASEDLEAQEELRYDPAARAAVRRITAASFGLLRLAQIMDIQISYLNPGTTNSALDNELALLWLSYYPRNGPWVNPLNFKSGIRYSVPTLMVSRLDAPDVPTVVNMIQTSIRVERDGLSGQMAINSYGWPTQGSGAQNAYKDFDDRIHKLAMIARTRANMPVVTDYTHIYRPREVPRTALYCGWYSLRHYVPGMQFVPGAVGYHVASLEMVGLHGPGETGWVHGLLKDGVVATLGAVAEPYLGAFPPPDEFFPLLMTGKLTLAEVYWKTEPATSWMICLIGDPLYTPFKNNPAMKVEDLPPPLGMALRGPTTRPYSSSRP
jgi:uncharacterized protein (TIGR03790 family)